MTSQTDLKALRLALNLSQRALGEALGLPPGDGARRTVARWEAGSQPMPGPVKVLLGLIERHREVRVYLRLRE